MSRYGQRTRTGQAVSVFGTAGAAGVSYGVATGGTSSSITVSSQNYTLLTFTSDGNLVVSTAGLFDVLMFGGGGAGGHATNAVWRSGGGGAGGILQTTVYLDAATYAVDIGAGATAATTNIVSGFGSSVGTSNRSLNVAGGGGGGGIAADSAPPAMGGCGGGAWMRQFLTGAPAFCDGVSGFAGGSANAENGAGGGGGTTAVGGNGTSGEVGGNGGAGYDVSAFIGGSTLYKGGGGGGGGETTAGTGGSSIGGNAGMDATGGTAAANTASGGGGAKNGAGGSGGSGIVYIRFKV